MTTKQPQSPSTTKYALLSLSFSLRFVFFSLYLRRVILPLSRLPSPAPNHGTPPGSSFHHEPISISPSSVNTSFPLSLISHRAVKPLTSPTVKHQRHRTPALSPHHHKTDPIITTIETKGPKKKGEEEDLTVTHSLSFTVGASLSLSNVSSLSLSSSSSLSLSTTVNVDSGERAAVTSGVPRVLLPSRPSLCSPSSPSFYLFLSRKLSFSLHEASVVSP